MEYYSKIKPCFRYRTVNAQLSFTWCAHRVPPKDQNAPKSSDLSQKVLGTTSVRKRKKCAHLNGITPPPPKYFDQLPSNIKLTYDKFRT